MSKLDWRERLFGKSLIKCDSPEAGSGKFETVTTLSALSGCTEEGSVQCGGPVCGVYFSFANISEESDDFPVKLVEVYTRLEGRLKIVQVVLWAHSGTPPGPAEREAGFRKSVAGKPWFAVPFHDVDTKRRLTYKYSIAVGVPALVVNGRHVRSSLLADPKADHFPWPAPSLSHVLRDVGLLRCGDLAAPPLHYSDLPSDAIRVFYFGAHWCPPCRSFAPGVLAALAAARRRRRSLRNTQLIFVSSDRSEEGWGRSVALLGGSGAGAGAGAGALAVPWAAAEARAAVAAALGVAGIPALLLLRPSGQLITAHGRRALAQDPDALNFPWGPRAVSLVTEPALLRLASHPALLLFVEDEEGEIEFAESVLSPAAESYYEEMSMQHPGFSPHDTSSSDETIDFDYSSASRSSCRHRGRRGRLRHVLFLVALEGTPGGELLREHLVLGDGLPLLVAVDFPRQRMAAMPVGSHITTHSVQHFLDAYLSGQAHFKSITPYTQKC